MAVSKTRASANQPIRFTGMSSGLDTEAIVNASLMNDKSKIEALQKKQQLAEWKQEKYRELIDKLKTFNNTYLDYTSATNMRSRNTYKVYNSAVTNASGIASTLFSVKGTSDALEGSYNIKVKQMAKASSIQTEKLSGDEFIKYNQSALASGQKFDVTLDGVTKTVTIGSFTPGTDSLDDRLKNQLQTKFPSETISVTTSNGETKIQIGSKTYTSDPLIAGESYKFDYNGSSATITLPIQTEEEAFQYALNDTFDLDAKTGFSVASGKITVGGENLNMTITSQEMTYDSTKLATSSTYLITANGISKQVQFAGGSEADFKSALDKAFKEEKITFDVSGGKISAKNSESGSTVSVSGSGEAITSISGTNTTRISKSDSIMTIADKLGMVLGSDGKYTFTIGNGKTSHKFTFNPNDSISSVLSVINSEAKAGVSMSYDELTDKINITSKQTGSDYKPAIYTNNDDSLDGAINLGNGKSANFTTTQEGQNSQIVFNGKTYNSSKNTFVLNGMEISLLRDPTAEETNETQTATLTLNVDQIYDNIKTIIDQYNDLVKTINGITNEKYDRDYQPLTDDEKDAMSDDEVKLWEEKAKKGILRRDSILQNITSQMRAAMYDKIEGVSGGIYSLGITTTENIDDYGILKIDETKLKAAIRDNPDQVMDVFAKNSGVSYSRTLSTDKRKERYNGSGVMERIYDIIQDNISNLRDSGDKKGHLLEKAGMLDDASEFNNTLTNEIKQYKTKITSLWKLYTQRENNLYKKYAALETAMSKLNSQSSSLAGMLGTGSN